MVPDGNQSFVFHCEKCMAYARLITGTIGFDHYLIVRMREIYCVTSPDMGLGFSEPLGSCVVPLILVSRLKSLDCIFERCYES